MNTFNLTLDLNKSRASSPVRLRQGDKSGTTITALILDHGATANLTGMTAQLVMELPDGTQYYRKSASVSGNVVTVVVDESTAASVPGRTANAYIQTLQGTTVKASTGSFAVEILPDALEGHTVPESYDSAIQDAIDALDAAVEQMPDMVEDVLEAHPEWTTTVQDGSITQAKLATDLARDRERLMYRLANMLTATLPEGETATATDAAKTPVAGLALYGRSTQDGTPTPSAPVSIENVGTANLIKRPYKSGTQVTTNGITWTVNDDGTITANGTATANSNFILNDRDMFGSHPQGTYTLSGSPAVAGCYVCLQRTTAASGMASVVSTAGNPTTFTTDTELAVATGNNSLFCRVPNGTTVSNAVFRPMLSAGSTAYPYVPYGHAGLWARGKNLLPFAAGTSTSNGVTFAVGEDGTITASGTSTGLATLHSTIKGRVLPAGTYTLSGCPSGGSDSTYRIDLYQVGSSVAVAVDYGSGATFTVGEGMNVDYCRIRIPNGANVSGKVFRPMLRLASTGAEFEPYTATVTPIDLDGHELRSLPDGTRDELTVDADGHAVLTKRVGSVTYDGNENWTTATVSNTQVYRLNNQSSATGWDTSATGQRQRLCNRLTVATNDAALAATAGTYRSLTHLSVNWDGTNSDLAAFKAALAATPLEIVYLLATPQVIDLGTIDPVPLCGPDLTAQAVPTAPFALTYERDLDATLARLESAIATLA